MESTLNSWMLSGGGALKKHQHHHPIPQLPLDEPRLLDLILSPVAAPYNNVGGYQHDAGGDKRNESSGSIILYCHACSFSLKQQVALLLHKMQSKYASGIRPASQRHSGHSPATPSLFVTKNLCHATLVVSTEPQKSSALRLASKRGCFYADCNLLLKVLRDLIEKDITALTSNTTSAVQNRAASASDVTPPNSTTLKSSLLQKSISNGTNLLPIVNLVIPPSGPIGKNFRVAVVGLNFGDDFRLRFGEEYVCSDVEVHCSTVCIASVFTPSSKVAATVEVQASNSAGDCWGQGVCFEFFDSLSVEAALYDLKFKVDSHAIVHTRMESLSRTMRQLEQTLKTVQNEEVSLIGELRVDSRKRSPHNRTKNLSVSVEDQEYPTGFSNRSSKTVVETSEEREIRIFVSSPFRDMDEERDLIVKSLVPRMRQLCIQRDVELTCVDLRWGLTEFASDEAATLLLCLREVQRCTLFLGFLGERYGWSLSDDCYRSPTHQDELLLRSLDIAEKEYSWLQQFRNRSVTELEMRAILRENDSRKKAFFFCRDPYYIESVPKQKKYIYNSEGRESFRKLQNLKKELASSPYSCIEYSRPSAIPDVLFEQLTEYIDNSFPLENEVDPFEKERLRHHWFAKKLRKVYASNDRLMADLDSHVNGKSAAPCVVIGENGIGKSALLSNWLLRYKTHHPEIVVLSHFVACSSSSTFHISLILRLVAELQHEFSDYGNYGLSKDYRTLITQFPLWLEQSLKRNKRGKVVILIDGLDKLDFVDNAHELLWLPKLFPSSVRVILSATTSSKPHAVAEKRDWPFVVVEQLRQEQRILLMRNFLMIHGKRLTDKQESLISSSSLCGNPLYLTTLLEDLLLWGKFEQLDRRIDQDLRCSTTSALYEMLLDRLERDYDKEKKGVVKYFTCFLWATRSGLTTNELEDLLSQKNICQQDLLTLSAALDSLIFSSSGLLKYSNNCIKDGVEARYLKSHIQAKDLHLDVGMYLLNSADSEKSRKIIEGVWQLFLGEHWIELSSALSSLQMFVDLYADEERRFELMKFWRSIEKYTDIRSTQVYINELSFPDRHPAGVITGDLFFQVASFFQNVAEYEAALEVFAKARDFYALSSQSLDVAKVDYNIACVKIQIGDYDQAEELMNKSLSIYKSENGENDENVALVLNRLGALYLTMNSLDKAKNHFEVALRVRREVLGPQHVRCAQTLKNLASVCEKQGLYDEAVPLLEEAVRLTVDNFGPNDLSLSSVLVRLGRVSSNIPGNTTSLPTLRRALEICLLRAGAFHPYSAEAHYELGSYYLNLKEFTESEAELVEALKICEKIIGRKHPDTLKVIHQLGVLYEEMGQKDMAEVYLQEEQQYKRKQLCSV